jgi:hypothetical protein
VLPVDDPLLLLRGKALLGHERHFGAEQADTLGAAVEGSRDVAGQADVDPQLHAPAVQGDGRQLLELFELGGELTLFFDQRLIVSREVRGD